MHPATRTRRILRTLAVAATVGLIGTTGAAYARVSGVDTSHYQHSPSLNWSKVSSDGVRFAFLKATEGSSYRDPYFKADWNATAQNGIYRGAYHFARPSVGSARRQADYFASTIGYQKSPGTLPPVLDLESTGGLGPRQLITWVRTFLTELEARTGRNPIIYVSPYFWIDHLNNSTGFHDYPLWVAHYGTSSPKIPGGWPTWSFWQSTSSGRIQGISGNVDKDVFNGSMAQLQKFALTYQAPAKTATSTVFHVKDTAPHMGDTVRMYGRLTEAGGAPISHVHVELQKRVDGGSWQDVRPILTGRKGGFAKAVEVDEPAAYRATFAATDKYRGSASSPVDVTLTPFDTSVTLTTPTTTVDAGSKLSLSGALSTDSGALAGRGVTVYAKYAGTSRWTRWSALRTDDAGQFDVSKTVLRTATYQARYSGEAAYAAARATTDQVTVDPHPTTLTFDTSNDEPYKGLPVSLRGRLVSDGTPVAGRTISIQRQDSSGSWGTLGTAKTDDRGNFSVRRAMTEPASCRAVYAGEWLYEGATTDAVKVAIHPPNPTRLNMHPGLDTVRQGRSTRLFARLTSQGHGIARVVRLWQRHPGEQHWHFVYKTTTRLPDGDVRIWVTPGRTTIYRLQFHGGNRLAYARHTVRVHVR